MAITTAILNKFDRSNHDVLNELIGLSSVRDATPINMEDFLPRQIKFVKAKLPRNRTNGAFTSSSSIQSLKNNLLQSRNDRASVNHSLYLYSWPSQLDMCGRGLRNLGNTCFMNSVLQCVTHLTPVLVYLTKKSCIKCRLSDDSSTFCAYCLLKSHVFKVLKGRNRSPFSPIPIARNLRRIHRKFQIGRQEDSHEFFRFFVDAISSSSSSGDNFESTIFQGQLMSEIRCTKCSHRSTTTESFLDLSLSVSRQRSILSALEHYCSIETLDGSNRYKCSKCRSLVVAKKRFLINKCPPVLCLQLKRFEFSQMSNQFGKINSFVEYPNELNISTCITKEVGDCIYKLVGIVVHHGSSCRSGHYISYVRSGSNIWYCMDDESVTKVGLDHVLSQNPYMLFYTKVSSEPNPERCQLPTQNVSISVVDSKTISTSGTSPESILKPSSSSSSSWNLSNNPIINSIFDISILSRLVGKCSTMFSSQTQSSQEPSTREEKPETLSTQSIRKRDMLISDQSLGQWEDISLEQRKLIERNERHVLNPESKKRKSWDIEYDQGREKKVRSKDKSNDSNDLGPKFLNKQKQKWKKK